jgi:hypothetical protein
MAAQPKLRPLIHSSSGYLLTTLQLDDYKYAISNVKELQRMVGGIRNQAEGIYGKTLPQALGYKLNEVEYVLRRVLELHEAGTLESNEDLRVFGDSLAVRLEVLSEELESLDQDPI